jgi:hypothetical protein
MAHSSGVKDALGIVPTYAEMIDLSVSKVMYKDRHVSLLSLKCTIQQHDFNLPHYIKDCGFPAPCRC